MGLFIGHTVIINGPLYNNEILNYDVSTFKVIISPITLLVISDLTSMKSSTRKTSLITVMYG